MLYFLTHLCPDPSGKSSQSIPQHCFPIGGSGPIRGSYVIITDRLIADKENVLHSMKSETEPHIHIYSLVNEPPYDPVLSCPERSAAVAPKWLLWHSVGPRQQQQSLWKKGTFVPFPKYPVSKVAWQWAYSILWQLLAGTVLENSVLGHRAPQ